MTFEQTFLVFLLIYVVLLTINTLTARRKNKGSEVEYRVARSGMSPFVVFMTFSATLFSTFTILGIPDFFRVHGLASWYYIGVTDVAMGFVVLWFGRIVRNYVDQYGFYSVSAALRQSTGSSLYTLIYYFGIIIFLIPYVAIQIRGVSIFFAAALPGTLSAELWSVIIVLAMFTYSFIGGLRAIAYTDVTQGILLAIAIWVVAFSVVESSGGLHAMMEQLKASRPDLLVAPGPKGLLTPQFLIGSFIAVILMPLTQPQLTHRVALARTPAQLKIVAAAISTFALIVLLPTIPLGIYGALHEPTVSAGQFTSDVLVRLHSAPVGALAAIGLLAAAMSTVDSQLFSLSTETESLFLRDLHDNHPRSVQLIRLAIIVLFVLAAFLLSLSSDVQLALLARVSFTGTALLAPLVLAALWRPGRPNPLLAATTLTTLLVFLAAQLGQLPLTLGAVNIDLALFGVQALSFAVAIGFKRNGRA